MSSANKEKIFAPLLEKLIAGYAAQRDDYRKLLELSRLQEKINSPQEIPLFTELTAQKNAIFEKISRDNQAQEQRKQDIRKALQLEEFTISSLRKQLDTPLLDQLAQTLSQTAQAIREAEEAERRNEDTLKKILRIS